MGNHEEFSSNLGRSALAIFCRAPRLGYVKTRLAKTHGDTFALGLYRAMLADTFALGAALSPKVETFAYFTPHDGFEGENSLAPFWSGPRLAQCEGDLGEKMLDCFAQLRARGFERIVVIGSDSPDVPLPRLKRAFDILDRSTVVIGRAKDGGFYLIGAKGEFPRWIFENVRWSSRETLSDIYTHFKRYRQETGRIYPWAQHSSWWDVDDAADLPELRRRLMEVGTHAPHTRAFLEKAL